MIALWMRTEGTHSEFWSNPSGQGKGCVALPVQNPFCTNRVMLHIELKVMKSRIQWCKNFVPGACLGVTRGQKVGFWVLFFSSPEPKAQGEPLWPVFVRHPSCVVCRPSVNNLLKRHLLLNQWMDFEIILQECSLGDPLPKLPKWFRSAKQNGRQS